MNLHTIIAVLATAASAWAEISYQGGISVKGPLSSCSYRQNVPAAPLYNQVVAPWPGTPPGVQEFPDVPDNQVPKGRVCSVCGRVHNERVCSVCGRVHNDVPTTIIGSPQIIPQGESSQVFPPQIVQQSPPVFPTQVTPQVFHSQVFPQFLPPSTFVPQESSPSNVPPSPNPTEKPSHIMKIPKKYDPSITITLNESPNNPVYPSFPYPRPVFYTQSPLLASCPATVLYPATIPYYPPYTCPAPTLPSPQNFPPSVPTTTPKDDRKTIASFTSTIPDTKVFNVTIPEKRDPLLTFKLLSAAVAKSQDATTPSPTTEEAPGKDCSMPVPPVLV